MLERRASYPRDERPTAGGCAITTSTWIARLCDRLPYLHSLRSTPCAIPCGTDTMLMLLANLVAAGFMLQGRPTSLRPSPSASRIIFEPTLKAFGELRAFDQRLSSLEKVGVDNLNGFFDASNGGFALTPSAPRFSVTTSIFGLLAIDANPKAWTAISGQAALKQRVDGCLVALLDADWREDDVAQLVFVLTALRILDPQANLLQGDAAATRNARLSSAIEAMAAARPQRRAGRNQPLSAYLRFWMAQASTLLLNPSGELEPFFSPALPEAAIPTDGGAAVELTLVRGCECAYDDVCRQLAFHSAGDRVSFDVVILAYSLMTLVLVQASLAKAVASRERDAAAVARDAVGSASALPPRNDKIVSAALSIIFDEMVDGLWPAGQPIFLSRGAGNNVGNAYGETDATERNWGDLVLPHPPPMLPALKLP